MRITYVVHQFFPFYYTGTERVTLNLAKQMQRMGHSVNVVTYGAGDSSPAFKRLTDEMDHRLYSYQGVPVVSLKHSGGPGMLGFAMSSEATLSAFETLMRMSPADVVHVMHPMAIPSAIEYCDRSRTPSVLTLTDFWLICPRTNLMTPGGKNCSGPRRNQCAESGCIGAAAIGELAERQ
jgi:glycosyltransferase involved in cell wall biosynthesis